MEIFDPKIGEFFIDYEGNIVEIVSIENGSVEVKCIVGSENYKAYSGRVDWFYIKEFLSVTKARSFNLNGLIILYGVKK